MTDITLMGKLVDLREADVEAVEEKWQTNSLKRQIQEAGLRKKGFMMPLDAVDVTERDHQLAKQFMPEIQLSGIELRSERNSKVWGGAYFRVLENPENVNSRVIQWIYVWTKQRFFVSLWLTVVPLFFLGLIGTLIYSYLSFGTAAVSIIFIGGIFFLLGVRELFTVIRGLTKGKYHYSNGQLFVVFGAMFWTLLAEIYFSKGSQEEDLIQGAESWHPSLIGQEVLHLEKTLRLSWVCALFFIIGIIALIFWKWEPPSFTHATHAMDWAPFFIYITKDSANKWQLDKVRYDDFHYYTGTLTHAQLKKRKALTKNQRPRFEIPNFWHSFRQNGGWNDKFSVLFGFIILIIAALVGVISFFVPSERLMDNMGMLASLISPETLIDVIRFVVFPLLIFIGSYLVFACWPKDIVDKDIDLADPIYHMTDNRLRIFWNLRGEEPALKVRSKLQDPFMDDEDFGTFRDDLEQIVFYNLLPKLRELEQKEFFRGL